MRRVRMMIMSEKALGDVQEVYVKFNRYIDEDGNVSCASDFQHGRICKFYGTKDFGTKELCLFPGPETYTELRRRKNGEGTLVPLKTCPIWSNDVK